MLLIELIFELYCSVIAQTQTSRSGAIGPLPAHIHTKSDRGHILITM